MMESQGLDTLVELLSAGFTALQSEYQKLHGQHQALERKLVTAREQYNELAKLCGSRQASTPPLSLSSTHALPKGEVAPALSTFQLLNNSTNQQSRDAAGKIQAADDALKTLRGSSFPIRDNTSPGVKIWSGPSADKPDVAVSSFMPSISESLLEQDFTVEGKLSKLGCPFAGMATRKLSSHAASVLSRYNQSGSICAGSTQASSVRRVNGKDNIGRRYSNRRESFADPIKAEICGMTDHEELDKVNLPVLAKKTSGQTEGTEAGVCPIRFLDQHSPEEVATYFQNHKHELPRSHEVCVMRYQSNEEQIRQLDAKYGNLVSMIQGLGKKHQELLPEEPQDVEDIDEAASNEKVRKWASSVSAQAADGQEDEDDNGIDAEDEDRVPHFKRPLRDIRVGESPSRPWGIPIPAKYLEKTDSFTSSRPVEVTPSRAPVQHEQALPSSHPKVDQTSGAKCPFAQAAGTEVLASIPEPKEPSVVSTQPQAALQEPLDTASEPEALENPGKKDTVLTITGSQIYIGGPVLTGYNAEDVIRILKGSGKI